jgi:hypothetical protein
MAYACPGDGALDYFPCRYGNSRLIFRGPERPLDRPYVAFLGGTETYGKFIPQPFPDLVETASGRVAVNLGCVNAGVDALLLDPAVLDIASRAEAAVLQVTGAANLSNRYYAVHPRRNDRFLRALPPLRALYADVDFTDFHFTRHLLRKLADTSPRRFETLAATLREAWVEGMRALVARIAAPVLLLWLAERPPPARGDLSCDPWLVDAAMLAAVRSVAAGYVEVVTGAAEPGSLAGMAFAPLDRPAAEGVPGPQAHRRAAAAITAALTSLPAKKGRA